MRNPFSRSLVLAAALAAGLAWLVAVPDTGSAAEVGDVQFVVKYVDEFGAKQRLRGAEVWIQEDYGARRYTCTNWRGVAVFEDVSAGVLHTAGVGPSFGVPRCGNERLRRPGDGAPLFAVVWNNNVGEQPVLPHVDAFYPDGGTTTYLYFRTYAPGQWRRACAGLRVTIMGTNGDDTFDGTAGSDVINARDGDDEINGLGGGDYICGGRGNDLLVGNGGSDVLLGEAGRDRLNGKWGEFDIVDGGWRSDWCRGDRLFECER